MAFPSSLMFVFALLMLVMLPAPVAGDSALRRQLLGVGGSKPAFDNLDEAHVEPEHGQEQEQGDESSLMDGHQTASVYAQVPAKPVKAAKLGSARAKALTRGGRRKKPVQAAATKKQQQKPAGKEKTQEAPKPEPKSNGGTTKKITEQEEDRDFKAVQDWLTGTGGMWGATAADSNAMELVKPKPSNQANKKELKNVVIQPSVKARGNQHIVKVPSKSREENPQIQTEKYRDCCTDTRRKFSSGKMVYSCLCNARGLHEGVSCFQHYGSKCSEPASTPGGCCVVQNKHLAGMVPTMGTHH